MRVLENTEPKKVFSFFEDICGIPHGSGDTKKISDYCVAFAKERNLTVFQDEFNNVIIKKPATKGYENHPSVILQGHLDMVCEKLPELDFDFLSDPLNIKTDGEYVFAEGTTLGGDDGIAVAMALSILDSNDIPHPAIEAVFTTDEETGMDGAIGLDTSVLDSRMLINIDSEDEGVLTAGCAGGARAEIELPFSKTETPDKCYKIVLSGLLGGHSGVEIDKGRHNSNKLLALFLSTLPDLRLCSISGGLKDNAIPAQSECIVSASGDFRALADEFLNANFLPSDPNVSITICETEPQAAASLEGSKRAIDLLCALPNGIISMSEDISYLVETSLNLGILTTEDNKIHASFSVRSAKAKEKATLLEKLEKIANNFGASYSSHSHYPAWEYRKDSPLRDKMCAVFKDMYGKEAEVVIIHAGLECGLFGDKIDGLDAVSIGPDMQDIHTPRERLSIASTKRTYEYLCEILKNL